MAMTFSPMIQKLSLGIIHQHRFVYAFCSLMFSMFLGWVVATSIPLAHPYISMFAFYAIIFCTMIILFVAPAVPLNRQFSFTVGLFSLLAVTSIVLASESVSIFVKPVFATFELCGLWFCLIPHALSDPRAADSKYML